MNRNPRHTHGDWTERLPSGRRNRPLPCPTAAAVFARADVLAAVAVFLVGVGVVFVLVARAEPVFVVRLAVFITVLPMA
jgi:hypothetical protein